MIVLIGKSGSGKSTIKKELIKLGLNSIITYTTRPIRESEVDGVEYHFITYEKFYHLKKEGFFLETTSYHTTKGIWYYGTSKESLSKENSVLITNPSGLKEIRKQKIPCVVFNIEAETERLVQRLLKRGDNEEEILRRLSDDEIDFINIVPLVDFTYKNINISPSNIAKLISLQASQFSKIKKGK